VRSGPKKVRRAPADLFVLALGGRPQQGTFFVPLYWLNPASERVAQPSGANIDVCVRMEASLSNDIFTSLFSSAKVIRSFPY
jgi:hypothetical protein